MAEGWALGGVHVLSEGRCVPMEADLNFDDFYRATVSRVIHLVYVTTGDLTIAQDCTQEAYARAWQRWHTVSKADDPLSWVRTVARRLAISHWRKDVGRDKAYRALALDREKHAAMSEDRMVVVAALRELSHDHREVLALFYLLDMSVEAIAAELGFPQGTIKARLHHGRAALASHLRPRKGDDV